jgi:hypothetical protein
MFGSPGLDMTTHRHGHNPGCHSLERLGLEVLSQGQVGLCPGRAMDMLPTMTEPRFHNAEPGYSVSSESCRTVP